MNKLVDVHTHLTDEKFASDLPSVMHRAERAGLKAIIVNGLNPKSNREILELSEKYSTIKPALGIYPIDAVNHLPLKLPFPVTKFDVEEELNFIEEHAKLGTIIALGECGLDGHWLDSSTYTQQERVFIRFIEIALNHDLPLIIHTRKRETRAKEILAYYNVKRVNFHCFGGKTKHAVSWAETFGWYFSIPANGRRNQAFCKMLKILRPDRILTETDAPYLSPDPGVRNEPMQVAKTIELLSELRGWNIDETCAQIWQNYLDLFRPVKH